MLKDMTSSIGMQKQVTSNKGALDRKIRGLPVGLAAILYTGWACRRRLKTTSPVMALQAFNQIMQCTRTVVSK